MDIVDVFLDDDDAVVIDHGDFLVFKYDFHTDSLSAWSESNGPIIPLGSCFADILLCASGSGAQVYLFSPHESGRQSYHKSMGVFIVWHTGRSLKGQYSSLPTDTSFIRLVDFIQSTNER